MPQHLGKPYVTPMKKSRRALAAIFILALPVGYNLRKWYVNQDIKHQIIKERVWKEAYEQQQTEINNLPTNK